MKDWKWASVRGCPDRMMAAKSHSISSVHRQLMITELALGHTFVEVSFVEVLRSGYVHVVQASDLQ